MRVLRSHSRRLLVASAVMLATLPTGVAAQTGRSIDPRALALATQNLMSDLVAIPLQFNFFTGGALDDRTQFGVNVQPVVPFQVSEQWGVVSRTIAPYLSTPIGDTRRLSGLGDIEQQFFLTPATAGELIWGAGPMFSFPTATDDAMRTGAWGFGPAAVLSRGAGPWFVGGLFSQLWTLADTENERPNLSTFNLQPFINYNFERGWAVNFAPIIIGDWAAADGQQWTVPVGLGFSKVTALGGQHLSIGMQYYHNAVQPNVGPSDQLKLIASLLYPKTPLPSVAGR